MRRIWLALAGLFLLAVPAAATNPPPGGHTVIIDATDQTLGAAVSGGSVHTLVTGTLPLPTGAATSALQSNVQSSVGTQQSTGITVQGNPAGVALPVSAATLPLPTGASTAANQTAIRSAPGTPQTLAVTVQGNAAGVPIPVTTPNPLPVSAATLPLPTGASTATNQTSVQTSAGTPGSTVVNVQGNASGVALPVSATALPLPSGAASATNQTVIQSTPGTPQTKAVTIQGNASGVPVPISGSITATPAIIVVSTTTAAGTITTGGTAQEALAPNASRKGWCLQDDPNDTSTGSGAGAGEGLWVRANGTAAPGVGSFISPNVGTQVCNLAGTTDQGTISVYAATTGHVYSVVETQ